MISHFPNKWEQLFLQLINTRVLFRDKAFWCLVKTARSDQKVEQLEVLEKKYMYFGMPSLEGKN